MKKSFILEFLDNLFSLQEKFLEGKYKKKMNVLNYSKDSMLKSHLSSGASLTLSGELERNKQRIKDDVKKLAKENIDNLENLLIYAKNKGASFYLIKNADKFLKPIKEEVGLIFPKKGLRALYLNLLVKRKFSFKTDVMFIFKDEKLTIYNVLYNFYKWYSYNLNLPGFKDNIQDKIKNIDEVENNIENLDYKDIISLKQAIERDREAMEFVIEFTKEIEGSKNAYGVMKENEGGASV